MGNVLHFCPCPQILHTYCKFSRENCENICDQYCKLWKYLWQILRTLSSFTSLLTELHYNHLHWPCLQISAISLSQISGPAQAIRDCLSDRNSLSLSQTTSNPFWQKTSVQPNSHSVTVQIPHKMTFEKCTNFSWDQTLSQFAFRTSSIPLKLIWSLQN